MKGPPPVPPGRSPGGEGSGSGWSGTGVPGHVGALPPPRRVILRFGALSGLLLALSFPPLPLPLLSFVALAPLALVLQRLPPGPSGAPGALLAGVACGAVAWGLLLHWIPGALLPVAPWSALPVFLLVVAGLALLTGAVARLALLLRSRGIPLVAGLPPLWVLGEWLRSALPGMEMAWLPLGNALVAVPALAAPAEWVGVLGLSGWAALAGSAAGVRLARSGAGGEGVTRPLPRGMLRPPVLPLLLVLLPGVAGWIRNATLTTVPLLGVAALQVDSPGSPGRPPSPGEMLEALAPHLAAPPGAREGVELLLLPEGTLPSNRPVAAGDITRARGGDSASGGMDALLGELAAGAARAGVPLVAGGYAVGERGEGPWNSALTFGPDGGMEVVHRKRHLVPGIEGGSRLLFRWLAAVEGEGRGMPPVRGGEPGAMEVSGRALGFLICYESAFPGAVRRRGSREVEAFLALTHEGWFGEAGLPGAIPGAQHVAHLRMRAVESRSGIVRSAADGEALIVDPRGRVVARGGDGREGWVVGRVEGVEGESLHARTPHLLLPGLLLLLLGGVLLPRPGGTRGRRPGAAS
jgi:apolipoprotein N-acyltransferase